MDHFLMLELVARAAGKEISYWTQHCPRIRIEDCFLPIPWNPLESNTDALPLVATMNLDVQQRPDEVEVRTKATQSCEAVVIIEPVTSEAEREAALRKAITLTVALAQQELERRMLNTVV